MLYYVYYLPIYLCTMYVYHVYVLSMYMYILCTIYLCMCMYIYYVCMCVLSIYVYDCVYVYIMYDCVCMRTRELGCRTKKKHTRLLRAYVLNSVPSIVLASLCYRNQSRWESIRRYNVLGYIYLYKYPRIPRLNSPVGNIAQGALNK